MKFGLPSLFLPAAAFVMAMIMAPHSFASAQQVIPTPKPSQCAIECKTDIDCPMTCKKNIYNSEFGTCEIGATPKPVSSPTGGTLSPTTHKPCPCTDPSNIPDKCEVDILIDIMEVFVTADTSLVAQFLRAAFHDAGTFDQTTNVGGANGCLLNHFPMRLEPENNFGILDPGLLTLTDIKNAWESHPLTCLKVSSADILQFAGFFATTRNKNGPETLTSGTITANDKRATLRDDFLWGRPDETKCDIAWTGNLPGFTTPASGGAIPARCTAAGEEIRIKMMDRNGFTAEEATALIGAHSIGMTRHTFGASLAGPWVPSGADNATPFGPKFGNAFHNFLDNQIVENDAISFSTNIAIFNGLFPDWFRVNPGPPAGFPMGLNHLDTDVALAFPSLDLTRHPDFNGFTSSFAGSDAIFLATFFKALEKMGKLGVTVPLEHATTCIPCGDIVFDGLEIDGFQDLIRKLGNSTAFARAAITQIQFRRIDDIKKLTTPLPLPSRKPSTKPSNQPTTRVPTAKPTTISPTAKPTTKSPTAKPTTAKPTTKFPTAKPTTAKPTTQSATLKPIPVVPIPNGVVSTPTVTPTPPKPVLG